MITDPEFLAWSKNYCIRFVPTTEKSVEFVGHWHKHMNVLDVSDIDHALDQLAIDPRTSLRNPRNHLPLIIEHAMEHRAGRIAELQIRAIRAEAKQRDRQRIADGQMTQEAYDKKWATPVSAKK